MAPPICTLGRLRLYISRCHPYAPQDVVCYHGHAGRVPWPITSENVASSCHDQKGRVTMVNRNEKPSGKARKLTSKVSASGEQATGLGTNKFGPTLRRLRDARDLSQGQLAEKAGMSIEAIGALERGTRRQPRKETVQLLADALALSPGDRAAFDAAAGYRWPEEEPPIGREREWERLRREFAGEMPMIVISGGP